MRGTTILVRKMIALEVIRNGKPVVTAGIIEDGTCTVMLSVFSSKKQSGAHYNVGGLVSGATHLNWLSEYLDVNDCITINVVEVDAVDEPSREEPPPRPDRNKSRDFRVVK